MALLKCKECGKEISDKAKTCPNCGCPIEDEFAKTETTKDIQTEPKKNEKKKNSKLSTIAAVLAFFTVTSPIAFVVAIIDLLKRDKEHKHTGSWFAIIFFIALFWLFNDNKDGSSSNNSKSEIQVNKLLCEDENISVYLDHIENGKIYVKYVNHSDENKNVCYSDLTINGTRYYKGIFVQEVYSNDDYIQKLDLYDKDGNKVNYNYESGTILGKFEYAGTGISFIEELEFKETDFNK